MVGLIKSNINSSILIKRSDSQVNIDSKLMDKAQLVVNSYMS